MVAIAGRADGYHTGAQIELGVLHIVGLVEQVMLLINHACRTEFLHADVPDQAG